MIEKNCCVFYIALVLHMSWYFINYTTVAMSKVAKNDREIPGNIDARISDRQNVILMNIIKGYV